MKTFLKDLILPSFWLLFFVIFSKNNANVDVRQQKSDPLIAKNVAVSSIETRK